MHTGWFGTKLSEKLDSALPDEAHQALAALKRYFDHDNLTETIRHNFAFHFIDEPIKEALKLPLPEKYDGFVAGDNLANIFYMFAENVAFHAMLLKAGVTNIQDPEQICLGVRRIYKEGLRVSDYFTAFANAVMVKIAKNLNMKVEKFSAAGWRLPAPKARNSVLRNFWNRVVGVHEFDRSLTERCKPFLLGDYLRASPEHHRASLDSWRRIWDWK